jgi:hypothetical protein
MALSVFVGTFRSLTTDAVNTDYTLTPGFTTKAGICFHTGRGDATDASGGATTRRSIGFFTSTTNRFCAGSMSVDGAAAGSGNEFLRNDGICHTFTADTTTLDGRIDVQSITSTQVVFRVLDVMPVDTTVAVICFGGDDITNATVVEFDLSAGTGTMDITTVGFQGTILFLAGVNELGPSNVADAAGAALWFGAATSSSDEHVWSGAMDQGSAAADTGAYCLAGECFADINGAVGSPGAMQNRAEFSAWLSNGFQLNKLAVGRSGVNQFALVIQGGSWTVGDFVTRTTTGTIVESGFGYTPKAILAVSALRAVSTSPNNTVHDQLSIGVTDGSTTHAQAMVDEDAPATMEVATAIDFDKIYLNLGLGDTVDGHIDFTTFDSDGFTLTQNDADPTANFAWYVACGDSPAAAGAYPFPRRDARIVPLI